MISARTLPQPTLNKGDELLHVQVILNFRDSHPLFDDVINTSLSKGYNIIQADTEQVQFSSPHVNDNLSIEADKIGQLSLDYASSDISISGYIHQDTDTTWVHQTIKEMVQAYIAETLAFMSAQTAKLNHIAQALKQ